MKNSLYLRMALRNLRGNYRFYIPSILTGTGLQACFYIVLTLALDERLAEVPGGSMIPIFMDVGAIVMALLSCILIFYSNSFVIRQRKKELGLYTVLGMEKRHVSRVLAWETLLSGGAAVFLGLLSGLVFYKLCTLLICRLLNNEAITGFSYISPVTLIPAGAFFLLLYGITCFSGCVSVARMNPAELLQSVHKGEQEPGSKLLILILGVLSLGGGYALSITARTLSAIELFFLAVFLVILGTYCLFTAGSIFILKALKKNKSYYCQPRHFTAVSGLLFRMKQNAAGLASIAVLATGVLIMISTTASLYYGMQETLDNSFPEEMYLQVSFTLPDGTEKDLPEETLTKIIRDAALKNGNQVTSTLSSCYLEVSFLMKDHRLYTLEEQNALGLPGDPAVFRFMTAQDCGTEQELRDDEIMIRRLTSPIGDLSAPEGTLTILGKEYRILGAARERIEENVTGALSSYLVAVSDQAELDRLFAAQREAYGKNASEYTRLLSVRFEDRESLFKTGSQISRDIRNGIRARAEEEAGENVTVTYHRFDTVWETRENILGLYGAFLFLGIILGVVCMFATVLIIYYKQISEGYEDRERYQIMKKVGMSEEEVRSSIRGQTRILFFLPLITAGVHTVFAFPILNRMLLLLALPRTGIFILCWVLAFLVFTLVYVCIYRATARTYYRIVA